VTTLQIGESVGDEPTEAAFPPRPEPSRIGPNAITRVAEALAAREGPGVCRAVFREAGLAHYLESPPEHMVPDADVARLHKALHDRMGTAAAITIGRVAGQLTADYLLANRIPRAAQFVLALLPRRLAAAILIRAIAKHAWTFAGAGRFSYALTRKLTLRLAGGPVARLLTAEEPVCAYYAATFERVFAGILGPSIRVEEVACTATGAAECVFELTW
jgi:divinyl protochlorophyllide a 8-vinyl-reductase